MEAPDQSKCADWREYFSTDEGEKSKEYFVYFEILRQNQAEKNPPRCARRLTRRFHNKNVLCSQFWNRGRKKTRYHLWFPCPSQSTAHDVQNTSAR